MLKLFFILLLLNSFTFAKVDKESKKIVKKLALLMVDKSIIKNQESKIRLKLVEHVMLEYSKKNRINFMSSDSKNLSKYLEFEKRLKIKLQKTVNRSILLYSFSLKTYSKVYLKYFNKKELKTLLKFYKSPTGKKFVKVNSNIANGVQLRLNKYLNVSIESLTKKLSQLAKVETEKYINNLK